MDTRIKSLSPVIAIFVTWFVLVSITFNRNLDLNGDNFVYYECATSLASGQGYSALSVPGCPPTAGFPPGYPLLMTPMKMVTDSVIAQKWMNEVFVLAGVLILYFLMLSCGLRKSVALTAAMASLFCPRVFHFSTMMMGEASFFMTGVLAMFALFKVFEKDCGDWSFFKTAWFYVLLVALVLNYHIRTQGIALAGGVCFCLLVNKKWRLLLSSAGGFTIGCLPWIIRNKMLDFSNRYLGMVMMKNPWRPEEGTLSVSDFAARFLETFEMLVFNAVPNTIFPYIQLDCDKPHFSFGLYVLGAILMALIVIGFWRLGYIKWALIAYVVATFGVISLFSTPSGNRYITGILPLIQAGLFLGIWYLLEKLLRSFFSQKGKFPAFALLLLLLTSKDGFKFENQLSTMPCPPNYDMFFKIAEGLKGRLPEGTVICSRKPNMFYHFSGYPGVTYIFEQDAKKLIEGMVRSKVDIVIVDNLGFSSTYRYLIPAIQAYPKYFQEMLFGDQATNQYVIRFDRALAQKELNL